MTSTRAEHAKKVLAMGLCRIVGIEPVDSLDGSPNWWMFSETASKVIDDLQERGFFKEPPQEPKEPTL
jgi:hypothetical protein